MKIDGFHGRVDWNVQECQFFGNSCIGDIIPSNVYLRTTEKMCKCTNIYTKIYTNVRKVVRLLFYSFMFFSNLLLEEILMKTENGRSSYRRPFPSLSSTFDRTIFVVTISSINDFRGIGTLKKKKKRLALEMSRDVWNIQVFEKWKASNNTEVYQRTCQKMMKMFSVLYCKLNLDSSVTISQWKTYFKSFLLTYYFSQRFTWFCTLIAERSSYQRSKERLQ